jgi:hypothetical protein
MVCPIVHSFTGIDGLGIVKTSRKNNERGSQKKGMCDIARSDKTYGKNRNTPKKYIPPILFIVIAEFM